MANFHTNNLVIAANDEDMKKVLGRMALNLTYNHETTGFADSVDDITDVRQMYHLVGPYIDGCYMEVFCGAPTGTAGMRIVQAADLGNGISMQVAVAPSGRGMSDTASVGFNRYGSIYVLTVDYSTAWQPNVEDLDAFFQGLPSGDYGIAFYDADEGDGYESISVFSGLHHGGAAMCEADVPLVAQVDSDDLRQQKRKQRGIRLSDVASLAKMARVAATRSWSEFDWDDDEERDDYEGDEDGDTGLGGDGESISFHSPPSIDWSEPGSFDLKRIDDAVLGILEKFPIFSGVTGSAYLGRAENIERIIAGDELTLVSDWSSPYFVPVGVEVFGPGSLSMGNLDSDWSSNLRLSNEERAAIACILPRVKAFADKVVPLSIRDGRSRHPEVIVRLEIIAGSLDGILHDVHEILQKRPADRSMTSANKEGR